jgi:uncharacterized protein YbjT (DUF2867 family)
MDLARVRYEAEQDLKASGLAWTILRPSCLIETWTAMIGRPLLETGRTTIYGHGRAATNFVSALDVAGFVDLAVADKRLRGQTIQVGGPNMTFNEFLRILATTSGVAPTAKHVPLPVMRVMARAMRPFNLVMARQVQMGVIIHTRDTTLDAMETRRHYLSIPVTTLDEVVRREQAARAAGEPELVASGGTPRPAVV